jgi:para-aminobenzoate synthetase component 1
MEIIEELEPIRRSLFYGSCGYLDQRGNLDLNILIRTLLLVPDNKDFSDVYGQVGAGIVADSDPDREWEESLQKAKAQLQALMTPNSKSSSQLGKDTAKEGRHNERI